MRVWPEDRPIEKQKGEAKAAKKSFLIISCAILLAMLAIVASAYIASRTQSYVVNGLSMNPTLTEGDKLLFRPAEDLTYGDVIVFQSDYGLLTKRVIGLPGDSISISADGHAQRNGQLLEEPYILEDPLQNSAARAVTVEQGHLFVLGDNRGVSIDSRDSRIGQVPEKMVCGRVSQILRDIHSLDS